MIKNLTLLFVLFCCKTCFSQVYYNKFAAEFLVGANVVYADLDTKRSKATVSANLDYYFTPYANLGFNLQTGNLTGGSSSSDPHQRYFVNNYKAISLNTKLFLGNFFPLTENETLAALKNFYVGPGFGIIKNKMTNIIRQKPGSSYIFPGKDESLNTLLSFNTGLYIPLKDYAGDSIFAVHFNFQSNFTFGEGLDGYDDPKTKFKNTGIDVYNVISFGLRYSFGPIDFW